MSINGIISEIWVCFITLPIFNLWSTTQSFWYQNWSIKYLHYQDHPQKCLVWQINSSLKNISCQECCTLLLQITIYNEKYLQTCMVSVWQVYACPAQDGKTNLFSSHFYILFISLYHVNKPLILKPSVWLSWFFQSWYCNYSLDQMRRVRSWFWHKMQNWQ